MDGIYYYVDEIRGEHVVLRKRVYDSGQWRIDTDFKEPFATRELAVVRAEKLNKEEG